MKYNVTIPVEITQGDPFDVPCPATAPRWLDLCDHLLKNLPNIIIPEDQFRYDKIVKDEFRLQYKRTVISDPDTTEVGRARKKGVVVVLESPHKHEYDAAFTPLGPLRDKGSQTKFRRQIARLLCSVGAPPECDIILANPIGLQTSLARLMSPLKLARLKAKNPKRRDTGTVRNNVFKALYSYRHNGVRLFEQDFINRLKSYDPALILNACTGVVKSEVQVTLETLPFPVAVVSQHPSYWGETTTAELVYPRR